MTPTWIRTKDNEFVQVAYIKRLYVAGPHEVRMEIHAKYPQQSVYTVSEHASRDDAKNALEKLMKRIGFGHVFKG